MELSLRKATSNDLDRITQLMVDGVNDSVSASSNELRNISSWNENLPFLAERLSSQESALWAAEVDGTVVGVIFAYLSQSPDLPYFKKERRLVVESLDVDRGYRHRGIGTALLKRIEQWGREAGVSSVELEVYSDNSAARGLYDHLGYRPIKLRMKKPLF